MFDLCRFSLEILFESQQGGSIVVNSVTVFDDYLLITFNFKEGETRLDFADIESSDLSSVGGPNNDNPNYIIQVGSVFGFIISIENVL